MESNGKCIEECVLTNHLQVQEINVPIQNPSFSFGCDVFHASAEISCAVIFILSLSPCLHSFYTQRRKQNSCSVVA